MQFKDPNIVIKETALQKAKEVSSAFKNQKYTMIVASIIREVEMLYKISDQPEPIVDIKLLLIDYIKNIDLNIG